MIGLYGLQRKRVCPLIMNSFSGAGERHTCYEQGDVYRFTREGFRNFAPDKKNADLYKNISAGP